MATPLGTNDLRAYRRHQKNCKHTKDTFEPSNKTETTADDCLCPIWVRGYLANELDATGKQKRVFCSTGYDTWEAAGTKRREWEAAGCLPTVSAVQVVQMDKSAITVTYAGKEWLAARRDKAGEKPLEESTLEGYSDVINQRLLPWCKENGIVMLKAFESKKTCEDFLRSWRQLKGSKKGQILGTGTKKGTLARFNTFLFYCLESEWIGKNGAKTIEVRNNADTKRYGLELDEYEQLLATPGTGTAKDHEKVVAAKLMRNCGLRLEDAVEFNSAEIVPNASGTGWNAKFIPNKTKKYGTVCIVPMPTEVKEALDALPGRVDADGTKHFFTISYSFLKGSILKWGRAAQKNGKPFAHKFSAHCLRHTFAIQNLNHGVPIKTVSRWLGHTTVTTTEKYYSSPLLSTEMQDEQEYQTAMAKMKTTTGAPAVTNVVVMKAVA